MDAELEFQKLHVLFLALILIPSAAPHPHSLSFSFPQWPTLTLTLKHSLWPPPLSSPPQLGIGKLSPTYAPSLSLAVGNSLHLAVRSGNLPNSLFLLNLNLNLQRLWVFPVGFIWFFLWVCLSLKIDLFMGFVWFVCASCFMVFSMICFGFVFIFYFYVCLWVCNANYVFDAMLQWTVYELWSDK